MSHAVFIASAVPTHILLIIFELEFAKSGRNEHFCRGFDNFVGPMIQGYVIEFKKTLLGLLDERVNETIRLRFLAAVIPFQTLFEVR